MTTSSLYTRPFSIIKGIHQVDFFLPWHRWFLLQYENLLRQIDCRVTVPYWDWSLVGGEPFTSDLWSTGADGIGGDGNGVGNCVNTGPFRSAVWSLPTSAGGGCLRRRFSGTAPDAIDVANLIATNPNPSDFANFELALRVWFHNVVHCVIDGTMCTPDSSTAPEFFLHHSFVDKIWWDWQKQSNGHKFNNYFLTQSSLMTNTPYRSRNFLDLNNQPDCVCVEYVNPISSVAAKVKGLLLEILGLSISVVFRNLYSYTIFSPKHFGKAVGMVIAEPSSYRSADARDLYSSSLARTLSARQMYMEQLSPDKLIKVSGRCG